MAGNPQTYVHEINGLPVAASEAVPNSPLGTALSSKKDRQDPVSSPTADGSDTAFIDTITQDADGEITVTKKNVQQASTSAAGIVQLSNAIDSTSESMAATPKAVHDAIVEAEQTTVAGLDATNPVTDGYYITSVDETDGIVSITTAAMDDVPTQDSSKPVKSGGVFASIGAEANDRAAADAAFQQLIPTAASEYNQLADKAYVDAIGERVEARYLSYSQDGLPFPTYDDFVAAQQTGTFYYMNALTAPNNNDVIVITADRTHLNDNNQPTTTRWRFFKSETDSGEWRYEYTINNSALSEAQLLAINSGVNADKVGNYDAHLIDHNNPHQVTKDQVGLGNVDNTSDADKPISTATQTALDGKADNVVDGTANNIVILGDNGKTLVDSHAAITSSYDGTDTTNPVTGSAVAAAIGELDAGPFGGEGKYIVSVSETAGVISATEGTLDAEPTENSTNPVKSGGVYQHLSTKADKDTEAVENNVAVFDENGNPVDSGISKDDLAAAISSAGSSIQGVSIDGTALTPDENSVVDIPLAGNTAGTGTAGIMSGADKVKLDSVAAGAEVNVQSDWAETDSESDTFVRNKPNLATVATTGNYEDLQGIPPDIVEDSNYVHTDNNYTDEEKTKLAGIETGAEVNVQADWAETDSESDTFVRNKPENLVQDANYVHTDNNYTDEEKAKLAGIEAGAEVNVIETVKVDDIPLTVTDKTVNIDLSGKADKAVPSAAGNLAGLDATGNLTDSGIAATSVVTDGDLDEVIESLDSEVTSDDGTNVQVKVTEVDGKISAVNIKTDNTESVANKVTSWSEIPTDTHYPTEKLVKDYLDNKETEYWIHQPSAYMAFVILADITADYGQSRIDSTKFMTGILEGYRDEWGYQVAEVSAIRVNIAYKWDTSDQKCICLESSGVPKMAHPMIIRDARVQNNTKYYFGLRLSTPMMMNFKFTGFKSSVIPDSPRFADINFSDDTVTWIPGDGTNINFPAGISTVVASSPIDWQVGKASQLITSKELAVLLSNNSTNTVFDGSTAVTNIKVRGTLGIENGGTGATNAADALANLGVTAALDDKADKVASATNGNFAGLDANGNLTDSGKNASDFATAAQGATADTAVQSVTLDGNELKSGTSVVIPLAGNTAGTGTAGAMSGADKVKLDNIAAGAEVNVQSDWTEADSNSDAFIKNKPSLATVATSGSYEDLSDKPTIPAAQVNSDWNATSGVARILNRPTLATVATSGSYNDLSDKPEIPEIPVADVTVNGISVVNQQAVAEVVIPVQQQADWTQSTTSAVDFIKNKPDLTVYATKVGSATSGNFAALDANGNLTDSGHKHSDYKATQTAKASPAASGNTLAFIDTVTQNENGEITATKKNVTIDSVLSSTSTNPVQNKAVDAALSGKADKATNLTGATKTKITYNSQGIVTAGADLEASDIPNLDASKITSGTLPVDRGGTGAGTVEGARTNLDVYSKSEVDARLSGRVEVVSALPATGETGVIYYVGPTGSGGDKYEEYIWAKEAGASTESWIKVGEPTIDLSGYKTKQTAKTSPSASGNTLSFIDTVSQNENGEITATKKNVTIDSALSSTSTNPVQNKVVQSAISTINTGKADKVTGATSGNFAALDANGNLADSGHKHSDYKTKQTAKSDPTASGTTLTAIATISQDANGVITATKNTIQSASGNQDGIMSSSHYTKLEGISTGANKVEASTTNGNIKIDGTETTVYTHPTDGANTSKGDTANQTPAFGGTFKVTSETVNAMGHTTVLAEHTVKIPNATAVASSGGTGGSAGLMSASDKEKLNGIAAGAEVNQNAFSNVKVGTATVAADAKTDTIELATTSGKHIVLAADTANDKVTIDTDLSSKSAASGGTAESLVTTGEKYTWNSKASGTHTHGNITNDGKIGSTADLAVVTGTSGAVTTTDLTTASPSVPSSGTTTSLSFIDTVSQDSKGKITATKKTVLVDSTYSSTGTNPVNGKAIAAAIGGLDSNKTSTDGTNVQVKVTLVDGKVSAVNVTTDNTENKNNKVSSWQTTPDNTHYPSEKLVKDSLGAKADKVSGATSGNFAGLDSNGNLTDSGSKASDFATSEQGRKADSAIQGVKVNNTTLTPDANKVVTVPLATTSADGAMSAADKTKLDGIAAGAEANVQADWNATSGDAFIPNKPIYRKYVDSATNIFKVCTVRANSGVETSGFRFVVRYTDGAILGDFVFRNGAKLFYNAANITTSTGLKVVFYKVTNASDANSIDLYAYANAYTELRIDAVVNANSNLRIDFSGFGVSVSALPEGATEITPVWVANSASSSGTAPVKVDAYGALTPVPMDSTPTASSTNLMTSGAIKTALDSKAASSHTHGNIQNGGALQTTDVAIANGDKLVITDASDSNKIARSSTAFDGSTITKALTQKGTFESVMLADDAMSLSATDGVKITYSGSTATISGNFAAGAGVGITYANNVATFSADIRAIPLATIYALS